MDVSTEEVRDERAVVMRGEDPGGRRPKAGGKMGGPEEGPRGVRSRAPKDEDSAGLGGWPPLDTPRLDPWSGEGVNGPSDPLGLLEPGDFSPFTVIGVNSLLLHKSSGEWFNTF